MWVNTGLFRVKMNSSSLLLPLSPQDSAIPSYVISVGQKQQWVGTEIWNRVLWNQYASWSRKSKQRKFLGKWPCLLAIITVNENSSNSWVWHVSPLLLCAVLPLYLFLAHSCMTSMTVIADQLKDVCYKTISDFFFDYLLEFSFFLPSFIPFFFLKKKQWWFFYCVILTWQGSYRGHRYKVFLEWDWTLVLCICWPQDFSKYGESHYIVLGHVFTFISII